MYAFRRQTSDALSSLNAPYPRSGGIKSFSGCNGNQLEVRCVQEGDHIPSCTFISVFLPARRNASAVFAVARCPSVVTRRYCIETDKDIIQLFFSAL